MNSGQESYDELAALIEAAIRLQESADSSHQAVKKAIDELSQLSTSVSHNVQTNLDTAVKKVISDAATGFTKALTDANSQAKIATSQYTVASKQLTFKLFAWLSFAYVVGIAVLSAVAWFFVFPEAQKSASWERAARYYYAEIQKICAEPGGTKSIECKPFIRQ